MTDELGQLRSAPLTLAALRPGQRDLLRQLSTRGMPGLAEACRVADCSIGDAMLLEELELVATYSGETLGETTKIGIRAAGLQLVRQENLPARDLYRFRLPQQHRS